MGGSGNGDGSGDDETARLITALYDELRALARARMKRYPDHTLQPTALVHEAYLRLRTRDDLRWNSKGHFFGAAAQAMRNVMVDHLRRKGALRRGGDRTRVDFTVTLVDGDKTLSADEILSLHQVLERLQAEHPDSAEVVQLHYFAGLTQPQIADVKNISLATVERYMRFARAWLFDCMDLDPAP